MYRSPAAFDTDLKREDSTDRRADRLTERHKETSRPVRPSSVGIRARAHRIPHATQPGKVEAVLPHWPSGCADAWFLDGFSPVRNAAMWEDSVLSHVARIAAPHGTLATFTAVGRIRRTGAVPRGRRGPPCVCARAFV